MTNMEPQQQTPRTTADSAKEGRLIVDAGVKKKALKKMVRDGRGGCGKKKKKRDGKGGPGVPDITPKGNPYLHTGKGGPGMTSGLLKTFARIPGVSYQKDVNRPALAPGKAREFSDVNTIDKRENLISNVKKFIKPKKK